MIASVSALLPIVVAALSPASSEAFDRPAGRAFASRSGTIAKSGMVCAAQPLAVQIGVDILKAGGNAVDAAIAVNAALGLMEPVSCGVGG
ncbi:MAG TPA: gamma-glutamyltransferase, partial [Candidatus Bathyarchaeia archaeon]|nr:gamma-glutamyltransferase [Candidatus Bathyarchaeia archaeon]